jgi:hypothetical protein
MRDRLHHIVLALLVIGASAAASQQPPTPHEFNDRLEREIRERLGARASEPASAVFKNIKLDWLGQTAAGDFVGIMNRGYARALGVKCTHCHDANDFASDELRPKRAAREMAAMHRDINQRLARMTNLEGPPEDRFVNCATCHRGSLDPRDARTR